MLDQLQLQLLGLSATNQLSSVDHSKKYSSGFNSQLTRQDSDGEILQDSSGVLVLVLGVVELVVKGMV